MSLRNSASQIDGPGRWYVVFDAHDGRVVHTHEFIDAKGYADSSGGDPSLRSEQAEHALRSAREDFDELDLRVLPVPATLGFDAKARYRVDVASGELKQIAEGFGSLRELARKRRTGITPKNK